MVRVFVAILSVRGAEATSQFRSVTFAEKKAFTASARSVRLSTKSGRNGMNTKQAKFWLGVIYNMRGGRMPDAMWNVFDDWCVDNDCMDEPRPPGIDTRFTEEDRREGRDLLFYLEQLDET